MHGAHTSTNSAGARDRIMPLHTATRTYPVYTKWHGNRVYPYSHALFPVSMVGGVMLCGAGSMFLVDYSLVQLFVSSHFSVLTTYTCVCWKCMCVPIVIQTVWCRLILTLISL